MPPILLFERRCYSNEEMVEYIYGANDPEPYTFLHRVRRDIKLHRVRGPSVQCQQQLYEQLEVL